jgi:hypothetical protein
MAARKTRFDPQYIRDKIQTQQLVRRLTEHVNGKVELSSTQVQAATVLLKKSLPDLSNVEVTGNGGGPVQVNIVRFSDLAPRK